MKARVDDRKSVECVVVYSSVGQTVEAGCIDSNKTQRGSTQWPIVMRMANP